MWIKQAKRLLRFKKGLTKRWSDVCFQDRSSEIQSVAFLGLNWDTLLSDPLKSYCWSVAPCGQSVEWAFFGVLSFCSPLGSSSSKQEQENETDSWRSLGLPVEEARLVNHKTNLNSGQSVTQGWGFSVSPTCKPFAVKPWGWGDRLELLNGLNA